MFKSTDHSVAMVCGFWFASGSDKVMVNKIWSVSLAAGSFCVRDTMFLQNLDDCGRFFVYETLATEYHDRSHLPGSCHCDSVCMSSCNCAVCGCIYICIFVVWIVYLSIYVCVCVRWLSMKYLVRSWKWKFLTKTQTRMTSWGGSSPILIHLLCLYVLLMSFSSLLSPRRAMILWKFEHFSLCDLCLHWSSLYLSPSVFRSGSRWILTS